MALPTNLILDHDTPAEYDNSVVHFSIEWHGALTPEALFRREHFLRTQELTRNGGLEPYIFTDITLPRDPATDARPQLCACETLRRPSVLGLSDGSVQDVLCLAVASVFTPIPQRRKGYASEMLLKLAVQMDQTEEVVFSTLYSGIGNVFYDRLGWRPMENATVELKTAHGEWPAGVKQIRDEGLNEMCERDQKLVRSRVQKAAKQGRTVVAILPDIKAVRWHKARERFNTEESYGRSPDIHGARTTTASGTEVWCYWACFHNGEDPKSTKDNFLNIIRLVVDDEDYDYSAATPEGTEKAKGSEVAKAMETLFQAARIEASKWYCDFVEIWNPSSTTLAAAQELIPGTKIIRRDTGGHTNIPSLRWCDPKTGDLTNKVEWLCNEMYAWN